jgi:hypothetical protein
VELYLYSPYTTLWSGQKSYLLHNRVSKPRTLRSHALFISAFRYENISIKATDQHADSDSESDAMNLSRKTVKIGVFAFRITYVLPLSCTVKVSVEFVVSLKSGVRIALFCDMKFRCKNIHLEMHDTKLRFITP